MDRTSGNVIASEIDVENAAEPNEGDAIAVNDWKCDESSILKSDSLKKMVVRKEAVNHPDHYGGKDNPYEARKVIRAWSLGFNLGNVVKYISRAGKKDPQKLVEDLKKARFYLDDEIAALEGKVD